MRFITQKWKHFKMTQIHELLTTVLPTIIHPNFKHPNSGGSLKFEDNNQQSKCKIVEIKTSQKVFALSLDIQGRKPFCCFNESQELYSKKNDGIIFSEYQGNLLILLIELKSDNPTGYLDQLKAGRNFVKYLLHQINTFSHLNFDERNVIWRYILFRTCSRTIPPKNTTKKISSIEFKNRGTDQDEIICTTLSCNEAYQLQKIKDAI